MVDYGSERVKTHHTAMCNENLYNGLYDRNKSQLNRTVIL